MPFELVAADEARPTVREIAVEALEEELDEGDAMGRMREAVRTPEDFTRWLAAAVAADGCELLAAAHLDPARELPELVEHVEHRLNEGWAKLSALEDAVRQAARAAGLPLIITTEAERLIALNTSELVMALGEAARREQEDPEASTDPAPAGGEAPGGLAVLRPQVQPAVVRMVRDLLRRAEQGEVQGLAVVIAGPDRSVSTAFELCDGGVTNLGFGAFDLACRLRGEG